MFSNYNGYETWGQISTRQAERPYVDPKELQRQERVAVGRICRCRDCFCCAEAGLTNEGVKNDQ